LWRDALRIVVAPDRLVLARVSRWRGGLLEHLVIPVTSTAAPVWHDVIDALARTLKSAVWQGCDVHVVLSDRLVRYLLVPAIPVGNPAKSNGERIASHYFREAFGDSAAEWACQMDGTEGEGLRVATAIDRDLLDGIVNNCSAPGYRFASLKPAVVAAYNRFRKGWGSGAHWFAVTESCSACLCLYQDGQWRQIRNIETEFEPGAEMARIIGRENLLAGIDDTQTGISIFALDALDHAALHIGNHSVKPLSLKLNASFGVRNEPARTALAMAG